MAALVVHSAGREHCHTDRWEGRERLHTGHQVEDSIRLGESCREVVVRAGRCPKEWLIHRMPCHWGEKRTKEAVHPKT